jgi:hypothetical protein
MPQLTPGEIRERVEQLERITHFADRPVALRG